MTSADALPDVLDVLQPSDFYHHAHETVYHAALGLFRKGDPVDAITVNDALAKSGDLARVGGATFLAELIGEVSSPASAGYYARIVADKAQLRRLQTAAQRILQTTTEPGDTDVATLVDNAQAEIFAVTQQRDQHAAVPIGVALERTLGAIEAASGSSDTMQGVPTGFRDLDALTGGLRASHMIVIAARPSIGKSTLGLDLARHAAVDRGVAVCLFTLEMDEEGVTKRLLSAQANVPLQSIDRGALSQGEWEKIARASAQLGKVRLYIDDSPLMTLASIRARCRRLKQQAGLGLVVIDYLQLLGSERRQDSRQVEVAELSRGLKLLAKELNVPVVALSQLNRGSEQRAEKRPMLSDMRESGAIEQDADLVILIHREDVYERNNRPGEADLIIAKHRNGPTGTVPVAFKATVARFADMATL